MASRLPLGLLFVVCAVGCTSPKSGATGTGSLETTGSSGSSSGGAASGTSSGGATGSSTGTVDAGCHHLGQVAELGACVLSIDCECPLMCLPDPQGNLLCQVVCTADSDCGSGEACDAGRCQPGPVCDPVAGAREFRPCVAVTDCACPLGCFEDGRLGKVCEQPCESESDCRDAGEFCESDAGSCQVATAACNPGLTGKGEFQRCAQVSDCTCPLGCFDDPLRGGLACELPCKSNSDCADAGGLCATDAGSCQPRCSPTGASAFQSCAGPTDCACPLSCLFDEGAPGVCAACDGGGCAGPAGSCVDGGGEAAASQSGYPLLDATPGVACTSNQDCDCPNACLPVSGGGGFTFACQPPLPTCSSLSDCADPTTSCAFGACVPNFCSQALGQWGGACDVANALAAPPGQGEGQCLPSSQGSPWLVCTEGGDGGAGCSLVPDRAHPETLCPPGSICVAGDAGSFCAAGCGNSEQCASGSNCVQLAPAAHQDCDGCEPFEGCLPGGPTCAVDAPTYLAPGGQFDGSNVGIEYAPCGGADCICPLVCNADPTLSVVSPSSNTFCERACQSDADCPLALASCSNQVCQLNPAECGEGGGLGSACDAGDGPGTCVYFSPFVNQWVPVDKTETVSPVAVCRANGPAVAGCSPDPRRGSAGLCGAGTDCLPVADGGFGCLPLCDPSSDTAADAGGCGAGQACVPVTFNANGVNEGTCLALGDGGCALGLSDDEFAPCRTGADCSCGLGCSKDWSSGQLECQRPCSAGTDCPLDEVCYGEAGQRSCQLNLCSGSTETCDADVAADGTCLVEPPSAIPPGAIPRSPPEAKGVWNVCYQAGTATGACDPSADRGRPDLLCVPGAVCDPSGPSPMCTSLCIAGASPSGGAPCPKGQYCVPSTSYLGQPASSFRTANEIAVQGSCLPALGVDAGP